MGAVFARMLNKGNRGAISAAVDALMLEGSESVADIGFGGGVGLGLLMAAVPNGHVHGVEPSTDMLARAGHTYADALASRRLTLHEAPMQSLPMQDATLDGWISINTIYFIADLEPAFRELARVLAPSGRGVVGLADPDLMASQSFTKHNFTLRPVADVVEALERAGLVAERRKMDGDGPPYNLLVCTH